MSRRLLHLIAEESAKTGFADGKLVEQRYGGGFHDAFRALLKAGYISSHGQAGTITLSPAGRIAALGN